MIVGVGVFIGEPQVMERPEPNPVGLLAPPNLYTDAQAAFSVSDHIDFRGNWEVPEATGRLTVTGDNARADARVLLDAPTEKNAFHFILAEDLEISGGNVRFQLSGDGTAPSSSATESWQNYQPVWAADATGAYDRIKVNPSGDFVGSIDNLKLFNLSSVDPSRVACDVIIIGGDSNVSNAVSEYVTCDNRETEFDGRIWYMPGLRVSDSYNDGKVTRHIPTPAIEPVVSMSPAKRMSPCHAIATELVEYSAARGRPLLIMALGEPGSGMTGSKGLWQKDATPNNNAPRMWDEMLAMKAAVDDLGPNHEIIGMVWSLGANDRYAGTDTAHETSRGALYKQFYGDVSAEVADVPMVLLNLGDHLESSPSEKMRVLLRKLDKDSGHPLAVSNLTVVEPPVGNQLLPDDATDPHFNAVGVQANGRLAGQTLRALMPPLGPVVLVPNSANEVTIPGLPPVAAPTATGGEKSVQITG